MPYTNTIVTTSTSGTWNGTLFSYSGISLIDGIPHSAQLEVERVFTIPRSTSTYATIEDFLNNSATTQKDKQQVFIIPASRITFDETNKRITAIDLPSTGNTYDYDPDGVGLANVPVPAIAVSDTLKVRRKTVSNQSLVEWSAGTKLTSAQLNLEVKQLLYLAQELIDKTTTEVTVSNTAIGTIPNYSIVPTKLSSGAPAWLSSGSVGIGTTSPSQKLHVNAGTIRVDNTDANGTSLISTGTGAGGSNFQVTHKTASYVSVLNSGGGIAFETASTGEKMRIEPSGNLILGNATAAGNTSRAFDIYNHATGASAASMIRLITHDAGVTPAPSSIGQLIKYQTGGLALHNTDTNAAAHIRFDVGNSERMRIDSGGNVGIGIGNPANKLHVSGSSATNESIYLANSSSTSFVQMIAAGSTGVPAAGIPANSVWIEGVPASSGNTYLSSYNNNLAFATGTSRLERMRISSAGLVGIGTASPAYLLTLSGGSGLSGFATDGTVGQAFAYASSTLAYAGTTSGHPYALITGNTERMRIDSSGALIHNAGASGAIGAISLVPGGSSPTNNRLVFGTDGTGYKFAIASKNAGNASVDRLLIEDNGQVTMPANLSASNTTTGTLAVTGGVGISGNLHVGNTINAGSTITTPASVQTMTTSAPAAGGVQCITLTSSNIGIIVASASPNGVITAPKGSLCINTGATAANTRLWINTNGGTGWAAVTSG